MNRSTAGEDARKFIQLSTDDPTKFDPSLGYLFQMPEEMQSRLPVCANLRALCESNGIKNLGSNAFCDAIEGHIKQNVTQPLFPHDMVICTSKEGATTRYSKVMNDWELHLPFFIQFSGNSYRNGSLFFIFRSSRDAVIHSRRILGMGTYCFNGKDFKCSQATEHCMDGLPCFGIIDWEIYLDKFKGRVERERFRAIRDDFPALISSLMIDANVLYAETVVRMLEKDKSREIRNKEGNIDQKSSSHFITSLYAFKPIHFAAQTRTLRNFTWLPATSKDKKDYSFIPDNVLSDPEFPLSLLGLDPSAPMGGSNGFTTLFSCNKDATAPGYPMLTRTHRLCCGKTVDVCAYAVDGLQVPPPHDPTSTELSLRDALLMLTESCYTVPKRSMAFYASFEVAEGEHNTKQKKQKVILFHLFISI